MGLPVSCKPHPLVPRLVYNLRPDVQRNLLLLAALFYLCMIVLGALLSTPPDPLRDTNDKLLHLTAYGVLSCLLYFGLAVRPRLRAVVVVLAIAVLGAVDEIIQSQFPHRHADPMDWLTDVVASIMVCAVLGAMLRLRRS